MSTKRDLNEHDHGRLQPQAVDLEEGVLGAILLEKSAISEVAEFLKPEHFYKEASQLIYKSCLLLFKESEPIDLLTVTNKLQQLGKLEISGGPYHISQLTNRVASAANISYHANIVIEKYIMREIIRISTESINQGYDDSEDCHEVLDGLFSKLSNLQSGVIRAKDFKARQLVLDVVKEVYKNHEKKEKTTGVPIFSSKLNERFGGWQPTDLIIFAARPSMGKSAAAIQFATYPAFHYNIPTAFFSLEMGAIQLAQRFLGQETGIKTNRFGRDAAHMNLKELDQKLGEVDYVYSDHLHIVDQPGMQIVELCAKIKSLVQKQGIKLIVIDYLQLIKSKTYKGNRDQELGEISRTLKATARDCNIPIIALSQLSRAVESRGGGFRPRLSDLRESGNIEQDADIVMFLNRPEYYGITEDENGDSLIGVSEYITAKYRNGSVGDDLLLFDKSTTKFKDKVEDFEESKSNYMDSFKNSDFDDDQPF